MIPKALSACEGSKPIEIPDQRTVPTSGDTTLLRYILKELLSGNDASQPITDTNYGYEDGNLTKLTLNKEGEPVTVTVGRAINPLRKYEDIFTREIIFEIEFIYGDEVRIVHVRREDLTPTKLQKYTKNGAPFLNGSMNKLYIEYLEIVESGVETIINSKRAGWIFIDDKPFYVHAQTFSEDGLRLNIQYSGNMPLDSNGTAQDATKALNSLIADSPPLQTAVCLGLFSVAVVPLGLDNQFIHVYGDSTTGKTSMLMLAASMHGFPVVNKGIVQTFFATKNAFMNALAFNSGVLAPFDEVSAATFLDEKFIYQVHGGKDKLRMGDTPADDKYFQTAVLTTGESSISGSANQNNGAKIRLLEFCNIPWAKCKEEAEAVKETACENYGTLGVAFAQVLMKLNDGIYPLYSECLAEVSGRLDPENRLAQRMANNISGLYFTARIAAEHLGLAIDSAAVLNILLSSETLVNTQKSLSERVMDIIKGVLATKWHLFFVEMKNRDPSDVTPRGGIGKIVMKQVDKCEHKVGKVIIEYGEYEKILKSNKFEDIAVVSRELYEKGYINCEKSGKYVKYYNRATLNGQKGVKVMDFYGGYFEDATPEEPVEHEYTPKVVVKENYEDPSIDDVLTDEN